MTSSSSSGSRGKLSLKGEKVQNLTFQRQTPKFLQQYQHLLSNNKKNYSNEVLVDEGKEFVKPGEKLTIEAIKASGAQVANEDIEAGDEDIRKIKALYERDTPQSILSRPNIKPMSASDAFGIEEDDGKNEEDEKAFDPTSQRITFKRKSKDISSSSGSSNGDGGISTGSEERNNETVNKIDTSRESNSNDGSNKSGMHESQKKKEKRKPIISFEYDD